MTTKRITRYALLLALSLAVSYLEFLLPVIPIIPGAKLGLANCVFLFLIGKGDNKGAVFLGGLRILLSAILFGGWLAALYSTAGAILAFSAMILLTKTKRFSPVAVSAAAAFFHNLGQVMMAMILLGSKAVLYYLPYLLFVGTLCGCLTGLLILLIHKRLHKKRL